MDSFKELSNSLNNLIESLQKLPGIGEKTAERLALAILDSDKNDINNFISSLEGVRDKIRRCIKCHNITEDEICFICKDKTRKTNILCVVEESKNAVLFERVGSFKGVYHILNGLISPLDGINPNDINIKSLIQRIKKEEIKEVILALKPSIEGETTALYIKKMLDGMNVLVSRIAQGVPLGADMEYIDMMTLEMALENRVEI